MEGLLADLDVVRKDFPILSRVLANGHPLVYLDSANTSQKPQVVIDTMVDHLERHNANIARAMHQLGAESTEAYEAARDKVAVRVRFRGTHTGEFLGFAATGRTVEYVSHEFYRIAGGLIAEEWICSDTATLLRQLS